MCTVCVCGGGTPQGPALGYGTGVGLRELYIDQKVFTAPCLTLFPRLHTSQTFQGTEDLPTAICASPWAVELTPGAPP